MKTLYKKTATGAIQMWLISTEGSTIVTRFGQVGGAIQEARDTVKVGKGKKTAKEQAQAEAESQWKKKKTAKGYVESVAAAEAGEVDDLVEGGIDPMLAFTFEKQGHKVVYPCYGNPKLDGTRCIATVKGGRASLWTRTRKPITGVPHIQAALEAAFPSGSYVFDGELYSQELCQDFEQIIHLVRSSRPAQGHEKIQYWVYDLPGASTFHERYSQLAKILPDVDQFVLVEATRLADEAAAMEYFSQCLQQGFEGAILRNAAGLYVGRRTPDLIKLKTMQDDEFVITGIEEGRGKLAGHVGAFVCETPAGAEFRAKLKGSLATLKHYFNAPSGCIGKKLTVRYQNLSATGVPRFPIGVAVRDYE